MQKVFDQCNVCHCVVSLSLSTYQLLLSICYLRFEAYCFRMSNFRCRLILASFEAQPIYALQDKSIAAVAVRGEALVLVAFYDLEYPVPLKKCAYMFINVNLSP